MEVGARTHGVSHGAYLGLSFPINQNGHWPSCSVRFTSSGFSVSDTSMISRGPLSQLHSNGTD